MQNNPLIQSLQKECQLAEADGILHGAVIAAGTPNTHDVLWAWGHSSVQPTTRAMRPDSVFDVASLTKVVATASACAICVDRGLLDPEAPASEYLNSLGEITGSTIRVCDLASHCSGYDNRKFDQYGPHDLLTKSVVSPAQWPARQRYVYACRNFIVLGKIVEHVTGDSLAAFCVRNIFTPLDMSNTAFGPISRDLDHVVPTGQPPGVISDEQARVANSSIGNAGLFSNAPDLAVFCQMMLQGGKFGSAHILGQQGLDWLTRPCSPASLPARSFGWDMRSCSECLYRPSVLSQAAIGHSGWTGQSLWIDPAMGLYVVVLTNRTHARKEGAPDNHQSSELFRARLADIALSHLVQQRPNKQH